MNAPEPNRALVAAQPQSDQAVDLFTQRGFDLACRIAKAFAASDAVPAQFRSQVEKKGKNGSTWTENPAAIGNCIVAIETARAVGMSITSVMQQANVIEGKLSWSAQFVIGAINASGRFTPLQFEFADRGLVQAKYREKQGWNDAKRGFDYIERTVEIQDVQCYAWAYAKENGRVTTRKVVGAPVSMKMAVEEGWYGKSGSKWQGEMATLMLTYRAGSFFGRIHAPDIVMGMGQTTEERLDVIDITPEAAVTEAPQAPSAAEPPRRAAPIEEREGGDATDVDFTDTTDEPPRKQTAEPAAESPAEPDLAADPAEHPAQAQPAKAADASPPASIGEKQNLRAKVKEAGYGMAAVLKNFGMGHIDPETLDGLTRDDFKKLKAGIAS